MSESEFHPSQFDASYQLRMITAYPVIAQMNADELMFGDPWDKHEAFKRILNARNLQTTHRLYPESKQAEERPEDDPAPVRTCDGPNCGGYAHE